MAQPAYLEVFSGDDSEMMDGIVLGFIYMAKLKRHRQGLAVAAAAAGS